MDDNKKNSLLIVDDEATNLKILNHILNPEYIVYSAATGEEALVIAKEKKPDLILLDIVMPEMDGYTVLKDLRSWEETEKIPVIFFSGLSSYEDEEKGLSLDAVDYISKPFSTKIVKLRVRNQIQIINQLRAIENLSMIDQLTNLPNRRSFDSRLSMEWKQAIREKTPVSLLMMDVDKFKNYNDTYGHQQGDVVLKTVAQVFLNSLKRPTDFAGRWGGEEFVVLLPNTPLCGALGIAELIRANVENAVIPCANNSGTKVTISIGVNTQTPVQCCCTDQFISSADEALYIAKQTGRNRVAHKVIAEE